MNAISGRCDRRMFIKIVGCITLNFSLSLCGCSLRSNVRGELSVAAKGFDPYNDINPNLRSAHHQYQTWRDNMIEHKVAWAGTQYKLPHNEKIVACADGIVQKVKSFFGYRGPEVNERIIHGGGIISRYFHMKHNSSNIGWNKEISRGDVVGLSDGNMPFKASMYRRGILEDPDHHGPRMGYHICSFW